MTTFTIHQEVLTDKLTSQAQSQKDCRLELKEYDPEAFQFIINCLYCVATTPVPGKLSEILAVTRKYLLRKILREHIAVYGVITVENVLEILDCALELNLPRHRRELDESEVISPSINECLSYIGYNAETILTSSKFRNTTKRVVDKVISYQYLKVDSEVLVFNALYLWVRAYCKRHYYSASPSKFRELIGKTIYEIKWGLIPPDVLQSIVRNSGLLTDEDMKSLLQGKIKKTSSLWSELTNVPRGPYLDTRRVLSCSSVRISTSLSCVDLRGVSLSPRVQGEVEIKVTSGDVTEDLLVHQLAGSEKYNLKKPKPLLPNVTYVLSVDSGFDPRKIEDDDLLPTGQAVFIEALTSSSDILLGHQNKKKKLSSENTSALLTGACFEVYHKDHMPQDGFNEMFPWNKV